MKQAKCDIPVIIMKNSKNIKHSMHASAMKYNGDPGVHLVLIHRAKTYVSTMNSYSGLRKKVFFNA